MYEGGNGNNRDAKSLLKEPEYYMSFGRLAIYNANLLYLVTTTDGIVKQENLYTEDLKGSTVNVLDNGASRVVSYWYDDFGLDNDFAKWVFKNTRFASTCDS